MGMSQSYGTEDERDDEQSIKVIHRALDLGCNFFDTAEVYGPFKNEVLLGKALKGRREQAVIATKFGFKILDGVPVPTETDSHPKRIKAAVDQSLKRLGTDVIDLYYQHRVDRKVPIEEVAGAVGELIKQGKVKYFGLSEAGAETIKRAHREQKVSALQSEYSLWERGLEADILPLLAQLKIGLVPFSPIGRGFLTGQIKSYDDIPAGDYRRKDPRYQGKNFERNLKLVDVVKAIARRIGAHPAQVALAWLLHKAENIVPIPGTKRIKYLEENCGAAAVQLSAAEMAELDALGQEVSGPRYEDSLMAMVER
jgi:aryl-alcohol dehydrogenase-like predicted oxidoreductase